MTLKEIIESAKHTALNIGGYNQAITEDTEGDYSFSRLYDGCCPEWYGKIIGKVVTYWSDGILKARYEAV